MIKPRIPVERLYKVVVGLLVLAISGAIVGIFLQIYAINVKINNEVAQIQATQKTNHITNNTQYSVILGYLICIGTIQPQDRTPVVISTCVVNAEKNPPKIPTNGN